MIKIIEAHYQGNFRVALSFSDGREGVWDGSDLLQRRGSLLEPLRDEMYFRRVFVDAGALCWPNGLEISPMRLHETCEVLVAA